MFANRKTVLEMPADASASAGGGAMEYAGFWRRYAAISVDAALIYVVLGVILAAGGNPFDLIFQVGERAQQVHDLVRSEVGVLVRDAVAEVEHERAPHPR